MQVGPEPDPTRDYTQHHHISLGGTREGPWAAQEASPWPRRWSDSSWVPNREEYFLRLEIILGPTKRASAPAVLLKAVGALPDADGEMMSPELRRSLVHPSNGLRVHP